MSNHSTVLRHWIERHNAGDPKSTNELLKYSEQRFRTLAHARLQRFQQLYGFVGTGDVLAGAQINFAKAMRKVRFNNLEHFLSLGARKIRQHLLDLKEKYFGPHGDGRHQTRLDPNGPEPVAVGAARDVEQVDVDEAIDQLPTEYRQVIDLRYYQGLPLADAAAILDVSVSTLQRRLAEAKATLGASFSSHSEDFVTRRPVGSR